MNPNTNHNSPRKLKLTESGSTLLEVLLAIVIFVVGMLALASLQGNLTRSSSDANMRTVAANIAEETIEGMRAFEVINTQAGKKAYDDIVDKTLTVQRGGVDYTVVVDVQPYYFLADRVSVSKTAPTGVTASSFKNADITVSWNPGVEFQVDETNSTSGRLGSGSITVSSIIPSILSLNNAKVAAEDDGALGYPPVNYTPGARPDIVAISLGDQKFKESTTPEPTVYRQDKLIETWFDVITYTTTDTGSVFLRREEFANVSCECTLHAASNNDNDGRLPTLWNGAVYVEGEKVGKPYGVSSTDQQSQYCDVCCQDHHDTESGPASYRSNTSSGTSGDHAHYMPDNKGALKLVTPGKDYLEACRLVRKDGFFRVAQDFNLESQSAFPEDYFSGNDGEDETAEYSNYVTEAVDAFYSNPSTPIPDASSLDYPGTDPSLDVGSNRSPLPTSSGSDSQQLRSRGIYADVLSAELQANLLHCFGDVSRPDVDRSKCPAPQAKSALELYPFFDVQVTKLARWYEEPIGDPVVVTNEPLQDNNAHSRGVASLAQSKEGCSTEHSKIETGNVGLISIAPVTADPTADYSNAELYVAAGSGCVAPPPPPVVVAGTISAVSKVKSVPSITGAGATCVQPTNTTFSCVLDPAAGTHTLKIGNYFTTTKVKGVTQKVELIACSSIGTFSARYSGSDNASTYTLWDVPYAANGAVTISVIEGTSCP